MWLVHGFKAVTRRQQPYTRVPVCLGPCWPWHGHDPTPTLALLTTRSRTTLAYEQTLCDPPASTTSSHGAATAGSVAGEHSVVFMHGLMGSGRNWRTFARKLGLAAAEVTGTRWRMVMLDLRCHGASARLHGLHPPHTLEAAAQDVGRFITTELSASPPVAILGHSLGGKVLLELTRLAQSHNLGPGSHDLGHQGHILGAGQLPPQVWVLDSQPGRVTPAQDERTGVMRVLQAVQEIKTPIPSRTWLQHHLKHDRGFDTALSNWLGSNVVGDAHGNLVWAFNISGVTALYHSYMLTDSWSQLRHPPPGVALHMVLGGMSDRWSPPAIQKLHELAAMTKTSHGTAAVAAGQQGVQAQQPPGPTQLETQLPGQPGSFTLHTLAKAGHNLHIDDPDGLLQLVLPHVSAAAQARQH